ncbi:hypothetical protein QO259_10795 [Salinicola sp. JS01]|uniref:hypothetical protein n=1 Tax=Salinicola sp. JS01 TaxID=3050071 RepID=UPI00255B6627|nr:hypothetical protein [Salinicola sp. JS01]WIX31320.1 hypothetical protein QO259_10795 [Salinicola sp. JS01]
MSDTTPAPDVPSAPEKTPSSDSASTGSVLAPSGSEGCGAEDSEPPGDAAPTLALEPLPHDFEVAPETLGAGSPVTPDRSAAERGENPLPAARDSAALALGDDLAPQAWRIDYQPPTLDLDDAPTSPATPSDDAAPEIELPPLDLDSQNWRPLGEPAPAEVPSPSGTAAPDGVFARGSAPASPAAGETSTHKTFSESRSFESRSFESTSFESTSFESTASGNSSSANRSSDTTSLDTTSPGITSGENTVPGHSSSEKETPRHRVAPGDTSLQRGIPVGWEVEEVEFEPVHRDNGRP